MGRGTSSAAACSRRQVVGPITSVSPEQGDDSIQVRTRDLTTPSNALSLTPTGVCARESFVRPDCRHFSGPPNRSGRATAHKPLPHVHRTPWPPTVLGGRERTNRSPSTTKQPQGPTPTCSGRANAHKPLPQHHRTVGGGLQVCLLYTSPSPRDLSTSRMPSSA